MIDRRKGNQRFEDACPRCGRAYPYGDPRAMVPGRQCFNCDVEDDPASELRLHLAATKRERVELERQLAIKLAPGKDTL
jgi:hypothetical protein